MSISGSVDFSQLEDFVKKAEAQLSEDQLSVFFADCSKELAARLLDKVIDRTPVGDYPKGSRRQGGTLRRGWTDGNKDFKVAHTGDLFSIEIVNPVEYASYVETGHRTPNRTGWVQGQFFLAISVDQVQSAAGAILSKKLDKKLKEVFK